jgi:D-3-phosphoglycerate dehydrogenase
MKRYRILITEGGIYFPEIQSQFLDNWDVDLRDIKTQDELIELMASENYDVVVAKLGLSFNENFFLKNLNLKILATPTTGLSHIDLSAASKYGIKIISLKGERDFLEKITSTAEHAWALLLACSRSLLDAQNNVSRGRWQRDNLDINQISGHNLGIIGYGRLGRLVANYGHAFGMNVCAYDPYLSPSDFPSNVPSTPLGQLLNSSDYVVLTATYNAGDPYILGRKELISMGPGAILINVSRGELVDEDGLIDALASGALKSVGLDVLNGDAIWDSKKKISSPIIDMALKSNRLILTPHIGGYAYEAILNTRKFILNRINLELKKMDGYTC